MTEKRPQGPYTVWVDYGYDGWKWTDYPTLEEAVLADKFGSSWVVHSPVTGTASFSWAEPGVPTEPVAAR